MSRPATLSSGVLAVLLGAAGCAREEMPPGHGPDFTAPAVVEMYPTPGAVVPDLDEDVYVKFDEPLGDPRSIERSLVSSPAWSYRVSVGRKDARIRPRDGWRRGVVYHFTIPPGVRDLVRNVTREPIELLFTTGAALTRTSTEGKVYDRLAVRAVRDARVLVIGSDSVPYSAVTDTGGSFALASLPTGDYWAFAFRDQNRNLLLDRDFEPHDSGLVQLPDEGSVVRLDLWLVPPDSTPPMLSRVQATDSLNLLLEFDDLMEPDHPLDSATVSVRRRDPEEAWPVDSFFVGQPPPPAPAVESAGEREEGLVEPVVGAAGIPDTAAAGPVERARPSGIVTVRLGRSLVEGAFDVSVRGFGNVRGLVGGGDTTFVYEPPPPPDPALADTVPAAGDTVPVRGDTIRIDGASLPEGGREPAAEEDGR